MRCLVLITIVALAVARPETYKEKEDFQYSRSSSDEGSKSGYYGAQRGNMGGNYERAHNMDSLAQHQMSGLVRQVDGELGDASNTKTGSVFAGANSRGIYGSGHYDLNNLEGRNFQEGTSYGNSHSQSALSNSANRDHLSNENRYSNSNSYSHSSRHSAAEQSEYEQQARIQSSNLRSGDSAYQQEYGAYGGSARLNHASVSPYQNRLVSTRPMKILVRPGSRVIVPIATETFDADHSASSYDSSVYNQQAAKSDASTYDSSIYNKHAAKSDASIYDSSIYNKHVAASEAYDSSAYNQLAAKSDAEVIANSGSHSRLVPANKHYESEYSYHKEWEKHSGSPGAVPLAIDDHAIPKTSELFEDSQLSQAYNNRNHQYSSNIASGSQHNSHYNTKSNLASSSHLRQQSEYDIQKEKLASDLNAFTSNAHQSNLDANFANLQGNANSKPKSYQSSYSYHKSWERQGDPYVIAPVPDASGQASQQLIAANSHNGYSSHQYGSNRKSHQRYSSSNGLMDSDCDDAGHIRVARSYNLNQELQQQQQNRWDDDVQQSQNQWDKIQDLGQQTQAQWDQIQDLDQQTNNQWDQIQHLGQQTQNKFDNIEDLGQQSQNTFDKIEDLGQQTQNTFDKIEDVGQQTQNIFDKIEDVGQQTQNTFDKIEDVGQQTQNTFDKIEDVGQQAQNTFDKIEDLGQQPQSQWDKIEELGQHSQNQWEKFNDFSQHNLIDQQSQSSFDQDQASWRNIEQSNKQSDINNYQTQEASSRHFYGHENKLFHNKIQKDESHFYTNTNTIFDGEIHNNDKHPATETVQSAHQNNYLHQQVTENTLIEARTRHKSSINKLWDKLDSLDRESLFSNFHSANEYNTSSHKAEMTTTEIFKDYDKPLKEATDIGRGDIETEVTSDPKDIGRGDIGSEDILNVEINTNSDKNNSGSKEHLRTPVENLTINQNDNKHSTHNISDKKQTDVSLESKDQKTDDSNNIVTNINTNKDQMNIRQERIDIDHRTNQHNINKLTGQKDFEKPEEIYNEQYLNHNNLDYSKANENVDQQYDNLDQQSIQQGSQNFHVDNDNYHQYNEDKKFEDLIPFNEKLDQRNVYHSFHYFDQQLSNQNNEQQNTQKFEQSIAGLNVEQENMDQNLQGFDKENFEQRNSNEHLLDFNKLNENFDQQSINQQFETSNHQNNLDQQSIDQNKDMFSTSTTDLDQVNLNQDLEDFSNIKENDNQQTINKHFDSFNQESEAIGQSFDHQYVNHNFNYKKINEKFEVGIPRENFDQQSLGQNLVQEPRLLGQHAAQSNFRYSVPNKNHNDETFTSVNLSQTTTNAPSTTAAPQPAPTGFWASVGKKFTNAKDKVSSWFHKSS